MGLICLFLENTIEKEQSSWFVVRTIFCDQQTSPMLKERTKEQSFIFIIVNVSHILSVICIVVSLILCFFSKTSIILVLIINYT